MKIKKLNEDIQHCWFGYYIDRNGDKKHFYMTKDVAGRDADEASEYMEDSIPEPFTKFVFCGSIANTQAEKQGMKLVEGKALKEELWDKSRVADLVRYYLDRSNMPVNTLANQIMKDMEEEGSKLPFNITDFFDTLYIEIDNYNSQFDEGLEESKSIKTLGAKGKKLNEAVEPQPNGYHSIWPINDTILVHNDGGVYHVVETDGVNNKYIYNTESLEELNSYLQNNFGETIVDPEPKSKPIEEPKKRYPLYMWKAIEDAVANMDNIPAEQKERFITLVGDRATTKRIPRVGYKSSLLPAKLRAKYGERSNYNSLITRPEYFDTTLEQALTDIYDVMKSKWFNESLSESTDYKVKFFQVFEAPKSPTDNGKMIGQRGTLEDANAFGKEKVGEGKYIIKAVCDDGQTRPIDNDADASAYTLAESEDVQYGVHQFSTDSIIFRGTEEECGRHIDSHKELWDDAEVYKIEPGDPHYMKESHEFKTTPDISIRPYDNEQGKIDLAKWYASKWPDDEVGIEQLRGLTMDDALKNRKIINHCNNQVKERVNSQLDKYLPIEVINESEENNIADDASYYIGVFDSKNNLVGYVMNYNDYGLIRCSLSNAYKIKEYASMQKANRAIGYYKHFNEIMVYESGSRFPVAHYAHWNDDTDFEENLNWKPVEGCYLKAVEKPSQLSEASYGGAYDIADDAYFTREDIDNFAEEVLNHVNETFTEQFDILGAYITDGIIEIDITNDELGEFSCNKRIDMRKIKEPWHLKRAYAMECAGDLIAQIKAVNKDVNENLQESAVEDVKSIETGPALGMASVIGNLIKDEYEAIDVYNTAIATAKSEGFDDAVKVLTEIQAEENIHIGQLQEVMKLFDPNASKVEDGQSEGAEQLANFVIDDDIVDEDESLIMDEDVEIDDDVDEKDVERLIKEFEESMQKRPLEDDDIMLGADLEEEVILEASEPWEDIYNSFKDIEVQLNGDGEAITATIDRMYQENKGNPDFEKAYKKWAANE